MAETLIPVPIITSRADIERLLTTSSKEDRISEDTGAILLRVLEFMQDMQINLENLHNAVNKKPDASQVCEIKDILSNLDLASLQSQIAEVESKIRAYAGDRIALVRMDTSINDLRSGVSTLFSSHCYKFSGAYSTEGGAAVVEISRLGVEATMLAMAQIQTVGTTPVSIISCKCEADKLVVTFSDDPSDDHVINYIIF
jgi:hypothetical protein